MLYFFLVPFCLPLLRSLTQFIRHCFPPVACLFLSLLNLASSCFIVYLSVVILFSIVCPFFEFLFIVFSSAQTELSANSLDVVLSPHGTLSEIPSYLGHV